MLGMDKDEHAEELYLHVLKGDDGGWTRVRLGMGMWKRDKDGLTTSPNGLRIGPIARYVC